MAQYEKSMHPLLLEIHAFPNLRLNVNRSSLYEDALQQVDQVNFSAYLLLLQYSLKVRYL